MCALLNISPLKWKLADLLYSQHFYTGKDLVRIHYLKEKNEYQNVLNVSFLTLMPALCLVRDGLKLSDVSGAAHS